MWAVSCCFAETKYSILSGFLAPFLFKKNHMYFGFFTPFDKLELSHHVCRLCVGHTAELF